MVVLKTELLSEYGIDGNLLVYFKLEVEQNGKSFRNRINLGEMGVYLVNTTPFLKSEPILKE